MTIAVMQGMQAVDQLDLGYLLQAVLDKMRLILSQYGVCLAADPVQAVAVALAI